MTAITETDTVVEFRGVGKRFGSMQALTGIDLSVRRGEVVVILGPSGSGKSTLCRCINRLEAIDEGHILIDGHEQPVDHKRQNPVVHRSSLEGVTASRTPRTSMVGRIRFIYDPAYSDIAVPQGTPQYPA